MSPSGRLKPPHDPTTVGPRQTIASVEIRSTRTINVPNGHGIVFRQHGGYFDAFLASPIPTCGYFLYWVVATDEATGIATNLGNDGDFTVVTC